MQILILGASGRTGQLATTSALKRGHTVTALVRNPASLPRQQSGVTVVQGTPMNESDLDAAFATKPVDAVIITLAVPRTSESPFGKPTSPLNFLRDCLLNTLAVMKKYNVKKIAIMSAFGIESSWVEMSWLLKLMFSYTPMKYVVAEHNAVDADIRRQEGLEWREVRSVMLKDGEAKPVREFGENGKGVAMLDSITRASVAEVLVNSVEGRKTGPVVVAN